MKVSYICHPISGDIEGNLNRIKEIGRKINLEEPDTIPFAHYFFDCYSLDDNIPEERERGIKNDIALMKKGFIDEVRLYGNRISEGMWAEVRLALELGIKIIPMTPETKLQLSEYPIDFKSYTRICSQDDCAPDAMEYFEKNFKKEVGEDFSDWRKSSTCIIADYDVIMVKLNYMIHIDAGDPFWELYKKKEK